MSDDDPTTPEHDDTTEVPEGLNQGTLAKANHKAGTWFSWIVTTAICIGGVLLLISLLLPNLCSSKERANRVKCASNLRQIGQGLQLYFNDHKCWPRTRHDPAKPLADGFTGGGAANPFAADGPVANDPTAAMFLLVKTTELNVDVFLCPSSNQEKDQFWVNGVMYTAAQRANFTGPDNLSYSFANMYPDSAAVARGYKWDPSVSADFAIAADRNDGDTTGTLAVTSSSPQTQQRSMNSRNHDQDGQNVLYADGHVDWHQTPWAGIQNDNIYTSAMVDANGDQLAPAASAPLWPVPQGATDTVLVPRKGNGF